ncbi:MAG: aminomethyl-transferring glycine dehydrogenase subunit GcvPA [Nitrososphaerota archaeon]|jgi:glycine dehydrogenase subunit 1|nr:aminomethyl-transferring glycine dehydrogenase subunit GcvPA [Nitrososphaerota archaeon]MCL5672147.1 aminomethyl-transferring glycine dehydrogenase subunit GcvPA [Nitrososphaerota archaeon]MDG6912742.1 aminomethyl-transferring glycine dehydrogenase subunit GcvPA [Nitrososphaerota archaeon]MDG6924421.1 aminomethyl-transferring glycine dehydrogenase subunit GcvPA [Nitrososphaerota archaeon]MDG6941127.1 aminomethyl-transferring glycine dehydrogenase subunit GcvPA [Nitrososphaerota archaeon]
MSGASRRHPFLPNLDDDFVGRMLRRVGAATLDDLFSDIPRDMKLGRALRLPEGGSEYSVRREIQARLRQNKTPPETLCFLGGGVWPHYVPAAVESITSRQEFYTSYTPYQAEVSQGVLQALFEYQSLMCDLLGMEACNSSLYDWASAAGEAVRMAGRVTGRSKALLGGNTGPQRRGVIKTYTEPMGMTLETVDFDRATGRTDREDLRRKLSEDVACLYFENPNYFGVIEDDAAELVSLVHGSGALAVAGVDPISLSLIREPGAYGADIAVGEGQPLGIPMNYGGPHLGIFAAKDIKLARSMPGRLIGLTTPVADQQRKAFAMVLQAREQHIRREGAMSNVCTNQSLMAVAAASYLSLLGKEGFRRLGETVIANSHFAAKRLSRIDGVVSPHFKGSFFKEFVVSYKEAKAESVFGKLAKRGVLAGSPTHREVGSQSGLYCVTEVHTRDDVEKLAAALAEAV